MGTWDVLKCFSIKFWYLCISGSIFEKIDFLVFLDPKIPKNSFSKPKISILKQNSAKSLKIQKKWYVNFFQKKILALMGTPLWYFLIFVKIHQNAKIAFFQQVLFLLFLLPFWVPWCCFSERATSGLSEKYMVYGVISNH